MIGWVGAAWAAPVLVDEAGDPFSRCVRDAQTVAGDVSFPSPPVGTHERVAVVVGVPCHRAEFMPSLAYATRDAVRVTEALTAGGFAVVPLLTVVDREDLFRALDEAERMVSPTGTVLVYFSGHGVLREDAGVVRRYLVMSDTDLGALATTGIEVRSLEYRVGSIVAGDHVLMQDTCYASRPGGKSVVPPARSGAKGIARIEPPLALVDGDLRLYASRFFEQAMESPELRGSVYTAHWLDAFGKTAADLDGDRCVGLIEAHRWAQARTAESREGFQVPQIQARRASNLLLGCVPSAPTHAVVTFHSSDSDDRLTVRGRDGAVVRDTGSLAPGRYTLRLESLEAQGEEVVPRRVLATNVHLSAGEWYDLDEAVGRFGPFGTVTAQLRLAGAAEYSVVAGGLSAWGALRDRGPGRLIGGLDVHSWPGGAPLAAGELYGWLGWSFGLSTGGGGRAGVGPTVGAGALWERAPRASGVGTLGQLAARGWWSVGRVVVSFDAGTRALLVDQDTSPNTLGVTRGLAWAPVWTVGLGGRL